MKKNPFHSFSAVLMIAILNLLFSCAMDDNATRYFVVPNANSDAVVEEASTQDAENSSENNLSSWTILVYMAADNELEGAAISDINEMENVDLPSGVNLLVLFDRAAGNDYSNGDWTETRLFKISKDESLDKTLISSEALSCEELGISLDSEVELDMGNEAVLSGFLSFACRKFPSENYGLIIWGHGAGWRGFSEDETNKSRLSLANLRTGIESGMKYKKLDFLGFDTCFSSTLEVAFEMKSCAKIMAGTPGIVCESGWNYELLFSDFLSGSMLAEDFAQSCQTQFEKTYENYQYGAFCIVNLSEIENLVSAFNDFAQKAALQIENVATKNEIFSLIEKNSVSYLSSQIPSDFYIDVLSMEKIICSVIENDEISAAGKTLENALNCAVLSSWNKIDGISLSVFFGYYKSSGVFSLSHPDSYVKGSRDFEICNFISFCGGYVPTKNCAGSLLDKFFYVDF